MYQQAQYRPSVQQQVLEVFKDPKLVGAMILLATFLVFLARPSKPKQTVIDVDEPELDDELEEEVFYEAEQEETELDIVEPYEAPLKDREQRRLRMSELGKLSAAKRKNGIT